MWPVLRDKQAPVAARPRCQQQQLTLPLTLDTGDAFPTKDCGTQSPHVCMCFHLEGCRRNSSDGAKSAFPRLLCGDGVKRCLHVFAPHVVVVLQDRWDAFLVLGQLLNSQCFNTTIHLVPNDSTSSKQMKLSGKMASNRNQQDTNVPAVESLQAKSHVTFSVDSVTQN